MRGKKRQSQTPSEGGLGHQPFKALRAIVRTAEAKKPTATRPPSSAAPPGAPPAPEDEGSLFLQAVAGAKPLEPHRRQRVAAPKPATPPRQAVSDEAEAMAELADLVTGKSPFDVSDSEEYVEGAVAGLDPRIVRRLRRGEFAHQGHLDLHGMTAEEARPAIDRFLLDAFRDGRRCVLIIHGRGLNSKDQIPVLKRRLTAWLARGPWARIVLAFTSARLYDGGAGALYVLLRRDRATKKEISVLEGAKGY